MRFVSYGRVDPGADEIPLLTQKHACQTFCEREKHAFEKWNSDECKANTPLLERDGFSKCMRHAVNNDIDGILIYNWRILSNDIGIVAGLKPLFTMTFDDQNFLYTPEGELDFSDSEDPEVITITSSMNTLSQTVNVWKDKMRSFKIKDSLHKTIQDGEIKRIANPPYGLESDKARFENRSRVREYYPDDREDDRFKTAIQVLNTFAHENTTPDEKDRRPTKYTVAKEYGIWPNSVDSIWKHQETYREVAKKHRPELTILF